MEHDRLVELLKQEIASCEHVLLSVRINSMEQYHEWIGALNAFRLALEHVNKVFSGEDEDLVES